MKNVFSLLFAFLILTACSNDNDLTDKLPGKWQLIQQLMDPGDGSGVFVDVTSQKIIEFLSDGTVESNGELCNMTSTTGQSAVGSYSLVDSTITVDNCTGNQLVLPFELDNSFLIISYPCIEPCRQKFVKVQ